MENHLSVIKAAQILGISDTALRGWIKAGKIYSCKMNNKIKIPASEIDHYIKRYGKPTYPKKGSKYQ